MQMANIIKWIKLEFYAPQRNKAKASAEYHRGFARYLEEKPVKKRNSRHRAKINYNRQVADSWQLKFDQLNSKIEELERNSKH